jgi:hypothetical protein
MSNTNTGRIYEFTGYLNPRAKTWPFSLSLLSLACPPDMSLLLMRRSLALETKMLYLHGLPCKVLLSAQRDQQTFCIRRHSPVAAGLWNTCSM